MAERLSGVAVSLKIQSEILAELSIWKEKKWIFPQLAVVLVGNDPASQIYVGHKEKICRALGFSSTVTQLDASVTEATLISGIQKLNTDDSIDAILIQLPLPKHINERRILEAISPDKDADCLTEKNLGKVFTGTSSVLPCTPSGVIEILKFYNIDMSGKNIAVVGRSLIVGMPLFHLLNKENATVTLFHSKSVNLFEQIKKFDVVCVAIGQAQYFKASDFKIRAVVVDIGIHRVADKLTGDVNFTEVTNIAAYTPVPGGVGPMTIAMLVKNTMTLARARRVQKGD